MSKNIQSIRALLIEIRANRLFRNSIWIMLSTAVLGLTGFIFWALEAHRFSASTIGVASTLISVITLLSTLCLLGLNVALMNHIPSHKDSSGLINSTSVIVILATAIPALIFCLIAGTFSKKLSFLSHQPFFIVLFIAYAVLSTLDTLLEGALTAYKDTFIILIKNTLISVVKVALGLLAVVHLRELFSAYYISLIISPFLCYPYLKKKFAYKFKTRINLLSSRKVVFSSLGNYAESIATVLPPAILPLILIGSLGAADTAYYYIAMTLATALYTIPRSVARNLIVEIASNINNSRLHIMHAIKILAAIETPVILFIIVLGRQLLEISGKGYSNHGYLLLVLLTVSLIPISINTIYWAIFNARGEISKLLWINLLSTVVVIVLSYSLLSYKLDGIGLAWLISQFIQLIFYYFSNRRSLYYRSTLTP